MVSFSFDDLDSPGEGLVKALAQGAKTLACEIWNAYPDQWTRGEDLTSPVKFFWNSVCGEPSKQPDSPPFQGGQCHKLYFANVTIQINNGNSFTEDFGTMWGKIHGFAIENFPNTSQFVAYTGSQFNENDKVRVVWRNSGSSTFRYVSFVVNSVYTGDGSPDNCGSLPYRFPPTVPPAPGTQTHNVTFNDGNEVDLTVPLVWNNIDFSVPITFDFSGGNITLNDGGIDVTFNSNNDWHITSPSAPGGLDDSDRNTINNTNNVVNNISNVVNQNNKSIDFNEYNFEEREPTTEEEVTDSELEFVIITVTKVPIQGKVITNNSEADTFFWAGYFCWTVGDSRSPHVVIQKTSNVYYKPHWATGYTFFAVNGAKLQAKTFKLKQPTPKVDSN